MIDSTQILLTAIIIVLTAILVVLGVQSFFVLREFRRTVGKANTLLDDVKSGANVAKIVGTIVALVLGKNLGRDFVDLISKKTPEKIHIKDEELKEAIKKEPRKLVRRFFKRRA